MVSSLSSFEPLKLRRPDSRRSTTQTWNFSSGMLTCGLPRLVVQVGPLYLLQVEKVELKV